MMSKFSARVGFDQEFSDLCGMVLHSDGAFEQNKHAPIFDAEFDDRFFSSPFCWSIYNISQYGDDFIPIYPNISHEFPV